MRICSVPGCDKRHYAHGVCKLHYNRQRNGVPVNGMPPIDHAALFWSKVQKGGPDECWIWTGSKTPSGYGQLRIRQRACVAHRFSYELNIGPVPNSLFVCHRCDNPGCVNPGHLFLGNQQDNVADMVRKGRHSSRTHPESLRRGLDHHFGRHTHCPHGHEYTLENTYRNRTGARVCKTCLRIRSREQKRRAREARRMINA